MFKWLHLWNSQIPKEGFCWFSCDTDQGEERKWMLRCCNIDKWFISFLDQRWNPKHFSVICVFVSITEAAFQAQLISCGQCNVLPEVTKILQHLLKLQKLHREQAAEAPSMKFWDVVCAASNQRGAKMAEQWWREVLWWSSCHPVFFVLLNARLMTHSTRRGLK